MSHHVRSALTVLLIASAAGAAPGATAEYQPPDYIKQPAKLPPDLDTRSAYTLDSRDVIRVAVANNLGITLVREQLTAARQSIRASLGAFDPVVTGSYVHSYALAPATKTISDSWSVGLTDKLRTGTELGLELSSSRSRTTSNAPQPGEPTPSWLLESTLQFTLTQPLLRGFSLDTDISSADVLRAEFASDEAFHDVETTMVATIQAAENAYWDLVEALKGYEIQLGSLRLAEEQVKLSEGQIKAGVLPPSDLTSAQSTLARRQLDLIEAERTVEDGADRLRQVLNVPRDDWQRPMLPLDAPQFEPEAVALEGAIERASRRRPELRRREIERQAAAFEARVANNEKLPDLEVGLTYGVTGQGDTYGASLDRMTKGDGPAWTGHASLTWEPWSRTARANAASADAKRRAAELRRDQTALDVLVQVRAAVRQLGAASREVQAAATFRKLAEENLDAEQRKFMNGTSSNFFVSQRQDDLARAYLAELSAIVRHCKARTGVAVATGDLLERRRIEAKIVAR